MSLQSRVTPSVLRVSERGRVVSVCKVDTRKRSERTQAIGIKKLPQTLSQFMAKRMKQSSHAYIEERQSSSFSLLD